MGITGLHHVSFSVTNLDRTIDFYTKVLGVELRSKARFKNDKLGRELFGTKWGVDQPQADLAAAFIKLGDVRIEFLEYKDPAAQPYHKNPSIAGSAHLALAVEDIEDVHARMVKEGIEFHTGVNTYVEEGKVEMKWAYCRDPDGIVLELVQRKKL